MECGVWRFLDLGFGLPQTDWILGKTETPGDTAGRIQDYLFETEVKLILTNIRPQDLIIARTAIQVPSRFRCSSRSFRLRFLQI